MSRLRRIALHSRLFFVTTTLLRSQPPFSDLEFASVAAALGEMRAKVAFALCGYCLMPDHIHAIIFPQEETTISEVMRRFKLGAFQRLRHAGHRSAPFWQSRFYDHALRTRREFDDALEYMHWNPVRKGLVADPAAWPWSSARWLEEETGPIRMDLPRLRFDAQARV
jgi:putative transposase